MSAQKRTKEQLQLHRARVAELALQQYTQAEIADILFAETGIRVSQYTISTDLRAVREEWKDTRLDSYEVLITTELQRIDALERELWRDLRASATPSEHEVFETVTTEGEAFSTSRVRELRSKTTSKTNVALYNQIMECHKERRKLLGLYAPTRLGIKMDQQITVKGYKVVSPDAWPEPTESIEGEYTTTPPQLGEGDS